MDYDAEIVSIRGENLALQTLVVGLLTSLTKTGNSKLAEGAFLYADLSLESLTMATAGKMPDKRLPEALRALGELREMTGLA
jgi:hypothetical protein